MNATADQVLAVAASQIGYYAKPGTPSKFGVWFGLPTGQWCAMFVSWCAEQAGADDIIPKHAYTPAGVAWFKNQGQWHNGIAGIRRGDILYFDFPGAPDRVSHVGLVESVNADGSVNTIEGNTAGTVDGDQRNGGLVARKRRKAYIVGFGRPAYSNTSTGGGGAAQHNQTKDEAMLFNADSYRARGVLGVLAVNGSYVEIKNKGEFNNLRNAGIPYAELTDLTLNELIREGRGQYWTGGKK